MDQRILRRQNEKLLNHVQYLQGQVNQKNLQIQIYLNLLHAFKHMRWLDRLWFLLVGYGFIQRYINVEIQKLRQNLLNKPLDKETK